MHPKGYFDDFALQLLVFVIDGTVPISQGGPRCMLNGTAIEWKKNSVPESIKKELEGIGYPLTFSRNFSSIEGLRKCLNDMILLQEIGFSWGDLALEPRLREIEKVNKIEAEKTRKKLEDIDVQKACDYLALVSSTDVRVRSFLDNSEWHPRSTSQQMILTLTMLERAQNKKAEVIFSLTGGTDKEEILEVVDKLRTAGLLLFNADLSFKFVGDYVAVVDAVGQVSKMKIRGLHISEDLGMIYKELQEEIATEISLRIYVPSPFVGLVKLPMALVE